MADQRLARSNGAKSARRRSIFSAYLGRIIRFFPCALQFTHSLTGQTEWETMGNRESLSRGAPVALARGGNPLIRSPAIVPLFFWFLSGSSESMANQSDWPPEFLLSLVSSTDQRSFWIDRPGGLFLNSTINVINHISSLAETIPIWSKALLFPGTPPSALSDVWWLIGLRWCGCARCF